MRDRIRYFLEHGDWKFAVAVFALLVGIWLAMRLL